LKYLSSPYTHDDPWVRHDRYERALDALTYLLSKDMIVFSPIVHSHHVDGRLRRTKGHDFWMRQSKELLYRCDGLIVLMLDGWKRSVGVAEEIEIAKRMGLPTEYMEWPQS